MSKPYSDAEFSQQITEDLSWRLKEISDLKTAVLGTADTNLRRALLRALVTVCYAHWEGYIRFAARKYLQHVALRKLQYRDLDLQFLRNRFLPRLANVSNSRLSLSERCALVDDVLNAASTRFSRVNEDLINTRSNLSFSVFADICLVCGVSIEPFEGKSTFVDTMLLKRRNAIAHGEEDYVAAINPDELANDVISLMRTFGDALENHVHLKTYRLSGIA